MGSRYKKSRKELRLAIFRSMNLASNEFTATLDRDLWGLPYKMIIAIFREEAKMQLHIPRDGLLDYVGLSRWHIH